MDEAISTLYARTEALGHMVRILTLWAVKDAPDPGAAIAVIFEELEDETLSAPGRKALQGLLADLTASSKVAN